MKQLTISIPIIPYLKAYATGRQYLPVDSPIDLSASGSIPLIIFSCLEGKNIPEQKLDYDLAIDKYSDQLLVIVPRRAWYRNKIYISDFTIRWINAYLMESFKDYVAQRVEWGKEYGISETETLYKIIHEFKMDDVITFDAIKKASYRVRISKGIIKKKQC